MNKYLKYGIAAGLLATVAAVTAEIAKEDVPAFCGPPAEIVNVMRNSLGQEPVLIGESGDGIVMLWVNYKTSTFTMVKKVNDTTACVLETGWGLTTVTSTKI